MNALMTAILLTVSMSLVSGCMPRVDSKANAQQKQEVDQALSTPTPDTSQNGSLWGNGGAGFLSDSKAAQVGDLVTIIVSENAKATRSLASKQSKTSDRKTGLSANITYGAALANKDVSPAGDIGMSNSKTFDGSGSTNNSDTLTASVTSVVMHVYPNGNMRVVGKRLLNVNHEPQEITFSGVIRPTDIAADNTIPSSKVAQARISYGSTGALANVTHEGWLSKTLDQVWPF
ncbi:MAG: flagellar basal body L-ring protein FlgH [Mariprofundus sp.]|nr:flagellar basal body L-ring protein FlgH [Mariprofundus sp.]